MSSPLGALFPLGRGTETAVAFYAAAGFVRRAVRETGSLGAGPCYDVPAKGVTEAGRVERASLERSTHRP